MSLPDFYRSLTYAMMKTEENGSDSILLCWKGLLSPIKELGEVEVLERHTSVNRDGGSSCAEVARTVADPTFPVSVVSDGDRNLGVCPNEIIPSKHRQVGHHASSPQLPVLLTSERRVDIPVTMEREEVTHSLLASRDHLSEPPSSRIVDLPLPVLPRITLPRFSFSPSGIDKMLECRLA